MKYYDYITRMADYEVRKTVTLPDDLVTFVDNKIKRLAQSTGEPVNLSKYIRDLIRKDKKRDKEKIASRRSISAMVIAAIQSAIAMFV